MQLTNEARGGVVGVGDRALVKSSDGKFYVADVLGADGDRLRVEFLRGGEQLVAADEVRPCSFLPGDRVTVDWPMWGVYTCTVVSYDEHYETVTLSDGWSEEVFDLEKVWLEPPKTRDAMRLARLRNVVLIFLGGAAIGSIATFFLMR
jgi:hypothetical protein